MIFPRYLSLNSSIKWSFRGKIEMKKSITRPGFEPTTLAFPQPHQILTNHWRDNGFNSTISHACVADNVINYYRDDRNGLIVNGDDIVDPSGGDCRRCQVASTGGTRYSRALINPRQISTYSIHQLSDIIKLNELSVGESSRRAVRNVVFVVVACFDQ